MSVKQISGFCLQCKTPFSGRRDQKAKGLFCSHRCWYEFRAQSSSPRIGATERPSTLDIAWAAGVYEGEGCCGIVKRVNGENSVNLQVVQKDRWLLERLRSLFGGSIRSPNKIHGCSSWHIHGTRARGFAMTIYAFLSPRRQLRLAEAITLDPG